MTDTPTLYDPTNIPIGSPGQPLNNGHLAAHSQIRDEIIVNANANAANAANIAALARLPQGLVDAVVGPPAQTDVAASTTVLSLTVALVAGRRYRVTGQVWSIQQTATGNAIVLLADTAGLIPPSGSLRVVSLLSLIATGAAPGAATWTFTAAATGADTFNLSGQTSAGTLRFPANNSQIAVEDIGGA